MDGIEDALEEIAKYCVLGELEGDLARVLQGCQRDGFGPVRTLVTGRR
jgi:hypothetical protein